jgi:hypothetical protein
MKRMHHRVISNTACHSKKIERQKGLEPRYSKVQKTRHEIIHYAR